MRILGFISLFFIIFSCKKDEVLTAEYITNDYTCQIFLSNDFVDSVLIINNLEELNKKSEFYLAVGKYTEKTFDAINSVSTEKVFTLSEGIPLHAQFKEETESYTQISNHKFTYNEAGEYIKTDSIQTYIQSDSAGTFNLTVTHYEKKSSNITNITEIFISDVIDTCMTYLSYNDSTAEIDVINYNSEVYKLNSLQLPYLTEYDNCSENGVGKELYFYKFDNGRIYEMQQIQYPISYNGERITAYRNIFKYEYYEIL